MGQVKVHDIAHKVDVNVFEHEEGGTCPYYIFDDAITDRIAACYSIKQDIKECQEAINYLKTIEKNTDMPEVVKSSLLCLFQPS